MRALTVKLVLAIWANVEKDDTVFYDGHLYRAESAPWKVTENSELGWALKDRTGENYWGISVSSDEDGVYDKDLLIYDITDRVPVVIPGDSDGF